MPVKLDQIYGRVRRLESRCTAPGLACIVLAGLATMGTLTPGAEPHRDDVLVRSLTAETIDVDSLHAGFLTAEQIVVKDAEGRSRALVAVTAGGMSMGFFDESGEVVWKAP